MNEIRERRAMPSSINKQENSGKIPVRKKPHSQPNVISATPTPEKQAREKVFLKSALKIIPLGGLGEIGKNLTAIEFNQNIIIIDCGVAFPDDDMFGVDLVLPDITYLTKHKSRIKGIFITHGHEDHIGGLPYFLKQINAPVYATKMTLGIVEGKLKEHKIDKLARMKTVVAGNVVKIGEFKVEFIAVNHSIPDACALSITTPYGVIFHTGDFKLDTSPIGGQMMNISRIAQIGREGVLLLMSESTNVEREGFSKSESSLKGSFDELFKDTKRRIIIATFASNVYRVQQIIDAAVKAGRKIAISGRSMENILKVAMELGYANVPKNTIISLDEITKYPPEKLCIITTGSQGEPMSALFRIAFSDHKKIQVSSEDLIILSSSPIPGNEKSISNVINELFKKGCEVVYSGMMDIHVSGHAFQEELKLMLRLLNPKFFMPVHGEFRHLKMHGDIAKSLGISAKNVFVMENGQVLMLDDKKAEISSVPVPTGRVYVDGSGVGDVGSVVLRDRRILAEDGLFIVVVALSKQGEIVSGPDIVSRGFVYMRESEDLLDEARKLVKATVKNCKAQGIKDWTSIKTDIRSELNSFLYGKTKRAPMILPILMEV